VFTILYRGAATTGRGAFVGTGRGAAGTGGETVAVAEGVADGASATVGGVDPVISVRTTAAATEIVPIGSASRKMRAVGPTAKVITPPMKWNRPVWGWHEE
jgi:hypothetical protein